MHPEKLKRNMQDTIFFQDGCAMMYGEKILNKSTTKGISSVKLKFYLTFYRQSIYCINLGSNDSYKVVNLFLKDYSSQLELWRGILCKIFYSRLLEKKDSF